MENNYKNEIWLHIQQCILNMIIPINNKKYLKIILTITSD